MSNKKSVLHYDGKSYEVVDLKNLDSSIGNQVKMNGGLREIKDETCEHCKHMTIEHMSVNVTIGTCRKGIYDEQLCQSEDYIVGSFGCNKWEGK